MKIIRTIFCIIFIAIQSIAFPRHAKLTFCQVKLVFHTVVGNSPFQFDSNYVSSLGDTFSITKFKYFVGNPTLSCMDCAFFQPESKYFLIDESDSASQIISLPKVMLPVTNLEFFIGVDSTKNVSGVQTGALDPATGMFWTWNSGYIMAKLEGKSPQSKAPFSNITYHIGGFRQKDNAIRKISLPLTQWPIVSRQSSVVVISINVDLSKWFDGPHPIKIAEKSFCMSPGKMAVEIADNYATMFSIKSISVQ